MDVSNLALFFLYLKQKMQCFYLFDDANFFLNETEDTMKASKFISQEKTYAMIKCETK